MDMLTSTKHPLNVLDRLPQSSATQSIAQSMEASAPKFQPESAEVPIGVLEVPIGVWGSRRVGSNLGQDERVELFAEDTCSVIVFPHGAVIRLSASIAPGQLIMVANRKSGQIILCRVVNVRTYPNVRGYAEIEFMQSTSSFWGPYAPQGRLKLATGLRPAVPSTSSADIWSAEFRTEVISILANAAVARPVANPILQTVGEAIENSAIQVPFAAEAAQQAPTLTMASESHFNATERSVSNPSVRLAGISTPTSSRFQVRRLFESLWGQLTIRTRTEKSPSPKRRIALVPVATSLFLLAVSGVLLLHYGTTRDSGITQPDPMPEAPVVSPIATNIQSPQPKSITTSPVPQFPVAKIENFPGSHARELADNIRLSRRPATKPTSEWKIPNGRLLAPHSTANRSAAMGRDLPPDLTAADSNTSAGAIQGFVAALQPSGGRAKAPQLLSSPPPNYPVGARQAHVEGQVTIDAVVDTTGKLTSMRVVSGSPLLQQAALDSLRTWKYQPGYLNEKPVPVKTSIIVNFRLR